MAQKFIKIPSEVGETKHVRVSDISGVIRLSNPENLTEQKVAVFTGMINYQSMSMPMNLAQSLEKDILKEIEATVKAFDDVTYEAEIKFAEEKMAQVKKAIAEQQAKSAANKKTDRPVLTEAQQLECIKQFQMEEVKAGKTMTPATKLMVNAVGDVKLMPQPIAPANAPKIEPVKLNDEESKPKID